MSSKTAFIEAANRPGANVAALCREHEISQQTGHKWLKRYRGVGYEGLEDQSRRPLATGEEIVTTLLAARLKHPRWGPRKLVRLLEREFGEVTPSERTVARVFARFGQVRSRRRRRGLDVPSDLRTI